MDVRPAARSAVASEWRQDAMTSRRRAKTDEDEAGVIAMLDPDGASGPGTDDPTARRCLGSARFGIEPHEAPITDFPVQPSQRDGLGRLCRAHWREYTRGLRRAALERKSEAPQERGAEEEPARPTTRQRPARASTEAQAMDEEAPVQTEAQADST
jgi:hypothetical protein